MLSVLEQPLIGSTITAGDRLIVQGWLAAGDAAVQVSARLSGGPECPLTTGLTRTDLAPKQGEGPKLQGFSGFVPTAGLTAGRHELIVTAAVAGHKVRTWIRTLRFESSDTIYAQWRSVLSDRVEATAPLSPQVTWFVRGQETSAQLATLASVHDANAAGCLGLALQNELPLLTTPFVGLLQAGDLLNRDAMRVLAAEIQRRPELDVVYADHDHINTDGQLSDLVLKPSWSPLMLNEPELWDRSWAARQDKLGPQVFDILVGGTAGRTALAAALSRPGIQIAHLPWPLTSEATQRRSIAADLVLRQYPDSNRSSTTVTAIVPTQLADQAMLGRCLDGLRAAEGNFAVDIIVVLNNLIAHDLSTAKKFLAPWNAQVLNVNGPFNWSALNNLGARHAHADWLLFLNDDVEPLHPNWLAAMLDVAANPKVGSVGAVLRYPDLTIQHAGVWLDGRLRWAGRHTFRHATGREPRVARWLERNREQSAVTGACLLTHRHRFDAVGGFDTALPVVFNDVDYCLRLRQQGWRSVVAGGAQLLHHEGISRVGIPEVADHERFYVRWSMLLPSIDPFWHPCLASDRDDWSLDARSLPPMATRP